MVQGLWFYEHRISESHPWTPIYCFGMTEFLPNDFQVMSFAVSASRASWFTYKVLCMKMLLDEKKDDITGIVVLTDKIVKRRVQDKSEILAECTTEEQRVAALKEHFGIVLSGEEQAGIKGTAGELRGEA
jgi:arylamine N-acetyltransferase